MTEDRNNSELAHDIDTVDELREAAKVRMASYQQSVVRSYNKNVRARVFQQGDWVLRKVFPNKKDPWYGKLDGKTPTVLKDEYVMAHTNC